MLFSMADAAGLFRLIAALYPREQAFANADKQLVGVWHSMLLDLPAAVISNAVCITSGRIGSEKVALTRKTLLQFLRSAAG